VREREPVRLEDATNFSGQRDRRLGELLRHAREERGISLVDLEVMTRIRRRYLEALEEERFEVLPPPVFVKGYLKVIAKALGLEEGLLIQAYAQASQPPPPPELVKVPIEPATPPSPWRRAAFFVTLLTFLLLTAVGYYAFTELRQFLAPQPQGETTLVQPETPQGAPQGEQGAAIQEPPPPRAPPTQTGLRVEVKASGRSWLRVLADGEKVFEGFLLSGETRSWEAIGEITLRVGNAGAIAISVNDSSFTPMGKPGQVVEQTFSSSSQQ